MHRCMCLLDQLVKQRVIAVNFGLVPDTFPTPTVPGLSGVFNDIAKFRNLC